MGKKKERFLEWSLEVVRRLRVFRRFSDLEAEFASLVDKVAEDRRAIGALRADLSRVVACAGGCGKILLSGSDGLVVLREKETDRRVEFCKGCGDRQLRKIRRREAPNRRRRHG